MRLFIICLLLCSSIFAQYTSADYELVKTTFFRKFDKNIITPYLLSENEIKIKSALLSISNSADTSFVEEIIKLDFQKFGYEISYTLGQLGYSAKSVDFLFSKLNKKNIYKINKEIYRALGKIGNSKTLSSLLQKSKLPIEGKAAAFVNFGMRRITADSIKLNQEVTKVLNSDNPKVFSDNLWSLSRLNSDSSIVLVLKTIALNPDKIYDTQTRIYALSNLRRLKIASYSYNNIKNLLSDDDWKIRTETARLLQYYENDIKKLTQLFQLGILDSNPNVAREAAISSKAVKILSESNNNDIKSFFEHNLENNDLTPNTLGELFISYTSIFPEDYIEIVNNYNNSVGMQYIFNSVASDTQNAEYKIELLKNSKNVYSAQLISAYTNSLLTFQDIYADNDKYKNLIFDIFDNNSAVGLGLLSFELDSLFIKKNEEELKAQLINVIDNNLNNFDFSETLTYLSNISEKIDSTFNHKLLTKLAESEIISTARLAKEKLEIELNEEIENSEIFDKIWNSAFKYKSVIVNTNVGSFEFTFTPQFTPISVGNFCELASNKYFNSVVFHRVVPNFVIQTGDTTSTGWGGPGYEIASEFSYKTYDKGAVGMASAGKDTEGSQWFVMHSEAQHLEGRYSNFGNIISGQEVVDKIDQGDRIISITLKK